MRPLTALSVTAEGLRTGLQPFTPSHWELQTRGCGNDSFSNSSMITATCCCAKPHNIAMRRGITSCTNCILSCPLFPVQLQEAVSDW